MRDSVLRTLPQSQVSTVHTSLAKPADCTRNSHFGCVSHTTSDCGNDLRKPLTAGNVCTMSPSDPSRTARNFESLMRCLTHGLQQNSRRMVFGISDDGNMNPKAVGDRALGNCRRRVV